MSPSRRVTYQRIPFRRIPIRLSAAALAATSALGGCAAGPPSAAATSTATSAARSATASGATSAAAATAAATAGPTAATAAGLVLRWTRTGGFAGRGGPDAIPEFSLYGDGRIIMPDGAAGAWPRLRELRLTRAGLRRVVAAARDAGLDRSRTLGRTDVADAFTLVITFVADGRRHRTRIVHPEGTDDPAVRFWRGLDPRTWPRGERAGPPRVHRPTRLAVLSAPADATTGSAVRWPLGRLDRGTPIAGRRCTVHTGGDVATVRRRATAVRPGTLWRSGGVTHRVAFRPLLPDERGCAALR